MADLQPTLLDTTLLQYRIFLGFATSFLRFPSHVSAFSLRLVFRGSFVVYVHIFVCFVVSSRFFVYLVLVSLVVSLPRFFRFFFLRVYSGTFHVFKHFTVSAGVVVIHAIFLRFFAFLHFF